VPALDDAPRVSAPVVALTIIDAPLTCLLGSENPSQSARYLGLTCSKYQSGEIDWSGRISRCGDEMNAGHALRSGPGHADAHNKWSWLKAWAMQIAKRCGIKKAIVALATAGWP